MVLGFLLLIVTVLSALAVVREFKKQNMFGAGFAGLSTLTFGFFSIGTLYFEIIDPLL
ncbi:DUF2759 family protein [Saliterribacillus persicus]|uniref:Uncharacterized protein DUF2759 n=1 Tax=Saliterribacillus persicus TaxID=930114 RepID=A0A368XDS5_9BACI|nr:DUF2759 family protein [Saliterribacillus persicus]RCW65376.1 uncharacterized protein DUF2759 [Saliterribacillus persicus]